MLIPMNRSDCYSPTSVRKTHNSGSSKSVEKKIDHINTQFLLKNMGFPTNSIKHLYKNDSINILMQFGCNIKSQTKRIIIKILIALKKLSIF